MIDTRPPSGSGFAPRRALGYFVVAYVLVTVLASAMTIGYGIVQNSPEPDALEAGLLQAPAFVATVPYHVAVMLVVWPAFAGLYFRRRPVGSRAQERRESWQLGGVWLVAAVLVDYVGFVLIQHQWSLTPHEFYVEYQPWISLIYVAIFLSPWIRLGIARMRTARAIA